MSRAPTDRLRALDARALAKSTIDDALNKVGSVLFSVAPSSDYRITTGDGQPLDWRGATADWLTCPVRIREVRP